MFSQSFFCLTNNQKPKYIQFTNTCDREKLKSLYLGSLGVISCRQQTQQEMTPDHDIVMHTDVSARVSPDSRLVLVLHQEEATQESLSPHAAGPSCATTSDDQNEPFFCTDAKKKKKTQIQKSLRKPNKMAEWNKRGADVDPKVRMNP